MAKRKKHQSEAQLWKYGCKSPRGEGADILRQQMRETHNYRNKLVELEQLRRKEFYELEQELFPDYAAQQQAVAAMEEDLENLRTQWKKVNAESRRRTENPLLKAQVEEAKKQLKAARTALKDTRTEIRDSDVLQSRRKVLEEQHRERLSTLRTSHPAFWGNTAFVEQQAAQSMRSGPPPRFYRWNGEGFVGVAFRTPITPDVLFSGKNTRAWLEPPQKTDRNKAGRVTKTTLHIAVESAGKRKLTHASIPIYFHRDFPPGCEITSVRLFCKRVADRETWSAVFMLRLPTIAKTDRATEGVAAIHFGWRRVPGGLLVSTVIDDADNHEELILPEEVLEQITYSSKVQAIRDHLWNETITVLRAFLKSQGDAAPEVVRDAAKEMHLWKRRGRLLHLINVWGSNRFPGDDEAFRALTRKGTPEEGFRDAGWKHRDRHLWQIEAGVMKTAVGRRKHLYQEFAADLRRRYRVMCTMKLSLKELQRDKMPEEDADDAAMTYHARNAAISVLQSGLLNSFGADWRVLPPAPVTTTCNHCKATLAPGDGSLYVVCEKCGETLHSERNAAKNTLAAFLKTATLTEDAAHAL